jgi:hypothetical protein
MVRLRGARRLIRPPALVEAPEPSTPRASLVDSEEREAALGARGQRVSDPPLQAPWIIVIASAAERKRLRLTPHLQTENYLQKTQTFPSVTKEDMTIDTPRGTSQQMTSEPPNGL